MSDMRRNAQPAGVDLLGRLEVLEDPVARRLGRYRGHLGSLAVVGIFVNAIWQNAVRGRRLGAHLKADEAQQIGRRFLVGPARLRGRNRDRAGPALAGAAASFHLNVFYLCPNRVHEDSLAGTADPGASATQR
jgi:hypothetical protein